MLFNFPTKIDFGSGAIQNLPGWVRTWGQKPLLVTDPGMVQTGAFDVTTRTLQQNGVPFEVFSEIAPNPRDVDVVKGAAAYRAAGCDLIIGLGGGSAIDGAKAVGLLGTHSGSVLEYDERVGGDKLIQDVLPPLIAIPTTAGTGSEVGRSTVVVDTNKNVKVVIFSPFMMPTLALIDPGLHVGMPAKLTAATGMDALTHCVEALLSKGWHPMADSIALGGIRLVHQSLARAVADGTNIDARGDMAIAATMGATAFQKGLGVIHSLAHPCSTIAGVHHGLANGVLIETGLRFNHDVSREPLTRIARMLRLGDSAEATIDWIAALRDEIGIPGRLRDVGVLEEMLPAMEAQALDDQCHLCNPKPVTASDIHELYAQAF